MSEFISCFACDNEPTQQCPRCGRPYCDDHGEELCDACLEPASGVPSFTLYRGSLLALLFGTLLAVWLLVQPADSDDALTPQIVPTATVQAQGNTTPPANNVTPQGNTTPATGATQPASGNTPAAGNTPATGATPGTSPTAGTKNYTVVSGDTLGAICTREGPASLSNSECVARVVTLNGLPSDSAINVGQVLRIPTQ